MADGSYATQRNYAASGINLAATGWSNGLKTTTACSQYKKNVCKKWITTTSVDTKIEQSLVGKWNGLGVEQANSPNHAVDNEGKDYDMLLLSFDKLVSLTSIDLGWVQGDGDVSILAFTGAAFDGSLAGDTWQGLLGDWSVVGNYNRNNAGSFLVNPFAIESNYFLIGAYNSAFGGNLSQNNDHFKLRGLSVTEAEVPEIEVAEPGSLVLLAFGLLGLCVIRRRVRQ